jgi:hypothetical protein
MGEPALLGDREVRLKGEGGRDSIVLEKLSRSHKVKKRAMPKPTYIRVSMRKGQQHF